MIITDILIVAFILVYILKGINNGFIKETISVIGLLILYIASWLLKNPVSIIMYKNLPFFRFFGLFNGISVLNIIAYEIIAFLIVFSILTIIYNLIIKFSSILDNITTSFKLLEIPSQIIGGIIGFIEGVIVVFIVLLIANQINGARKYLEESKLSDYILTNTPILSKATSPIYNTIDEIYRVALENKDNPNKNEANLKALDILLKYKIIDYDNTKYLIDNKKLIMKNYETVLSKYENN